MIVGSSAGRPREQPPLSKHEAKIREVFLANIKADIENRLKASIHRACFLHLGVEGDPAAARSPWVFSHPEEKRSYASTWDAYEESKGKLLLLGRPGAGKTTAILTIAERLIRNAIASADAPVPILLNLSKFRFVKISSDIQPDEAGAATASGEPNAFEEWVVAETMKLTRLNRAAVRRWLGEGRIALLLDGLDEFKDEHRDRLARLLNREFFYHRAEVPVVICCRINEYRILASHEGSRLEMQGCIELQPLTDPQIAEYLKAAKAEPLLQALPNDASLQELSRTPLTLSMLVLAYSGEAPKPQPTLSETRFRLFEAFISRMLQRQARRTRGIQFDEDREKDVPPSQYRYPPSVIERTLSWLAITMSVRKNSTFSQHALVRLLLGAPHIGGAFSNFWAAYSAMGVLLATSLLLMALPIMPLSYGGGFGLLGIIVVAWLVLPWHAGAVQKKRSFISLWPVLPAAVAAVAYSYQLTKILPDGISVHTVIPMSLGAIFVLATWFRDDIPNRLLGWMAVAAILVALLHIYPLPFELALRQFAPSVSTRTLETAITWFFVSGGIVAHAGSSNDGVNYNPTVNFSHFIFSAILSIAFAYGFHALTPFMVFWLQATTVLWIYSESREEFRGVALIVLALAPCIFFGGALGGISGSLMATLLLAVPASLAGAAYALRSNVRVSSARIATLSEPVFAAIERYVLSRFAWFLLASLQRVASGRNRFLGSVVDAFMLKRSANDLEFIHLLLRDYFALRELLQQLKQGGQATIDAIDALGFQGETALDTLLEYAELDDPQLRAAAVRALAHIASPASTKALERRIDDVAPEVRVALIDTIAYLSSDNKSAFFSRMTPLGRADEVKAILNIANNLNPSSIALDYLNRMGPVAVGHLVSVLAGRDDPSTIVMAIRFLAQLRDDRIFEALAFQLHHKYDIVKFNAIDALAAYKDIRAIGELRKMEPIHDDKVKQAQRVALDKLYRLYPEEARRADIGLQV